MNNVYLDGSINTDVGANDGQYTQLSMDAVGEFKVQTSVFNAEYGRNPGVLISATTKSGSSQTSTAPPMSSCATMPPTPTRGSTTCRAKRSRLCASTSLAATSAARSTCRTFPRRRTRSCSSSSTMREPAPAARTAATSMTFPVPEELNGNFSKALRFNADGSPVLLNGSQFNIGTVFQPGTVVRNACRQHHRRYALSGQHHSANRSSARMPRRSSRCFRPAIAA